MSPAVSKPPALCNSSRSRGRSGQSEPRAGLVVRYGACRVNGASSEPLVVVVVLNWNGAGMTIDCVRSIQTSRWTQQRVVVVDNGSTDGSADLIAENCPGVELLVNERNLGFAGGNNVGIHRAMETGADYILILNNDTLIDPDTVGELVAEAERRPEAGAVSPLIFFADPSDQLWFAGADFNPARGYAGRMLGYGERDTGRFAEVAKTDRLTGAAMLVSRRAVERTGVFDDELFFLYEDVDWSLRMREAGFLLYVVPAARVWHRVAATQGSEHSPLSIYYGTRNQLVVSRRHAPLSRGASLRRAFVASAVNLARLRHASHRLLGLRAFLQGLADGLTGRLGPWRQSA